MQRRGRGTGNLRSACITAMASRQIRRQWCRNTRKNWFGEGTEVIFACGDTVVDSAAVEADIAGGRVIASAPPKRAVQNILAYVEPVYTDSVREQLAAVYTDGFEGGRILTPGASDDAWQLCMKEDQFSYFRQERLRGGLQAAAGRTAQAGFRRQGEVCCRAG